MYIRDLAPYSRLVEEDSKCLVAVGWLSAERGFETGDVPNEFRRALSTICAEPVRKSRGFHVCPFCDGDTPEVGNGEVHIAGADCVYVAPALIGHYVDVHRYKPPAPFIEAVRAMSKNHVKDCNSELSDKLVCFADSQDERHKWEFYESLLTGRVGVRVPQELGSVPSGEYVVAAQSDLQIPTAKSPTGEDLLVVLANVAWLHEREPGSVFLEMDGRDVLRLARERGAGVIVQVLGPNRQAWCGVPAADVKKLLVGERQNCDR